MACFKPLRFGTCLPLLHSLAHADRDAALQRKQSRLHGGGGTNEPGEEVAGALTVPSALTDGL